MKRYRRCAYFMDRNLNESLQENNIKKDLIKFDLRNQIINRKYFKPTNFDRYIRF